MGVEQSQVLMVRQPIFDRQLKIIAYQLRYQYSELIEDSLFDHETEGALLVMHTFTSLFQDGQIRKVPVFLPLSPSSMLEGGNPLLLPKRGFVIEINPAIEVNDSLIKHLKLLSQQGYRLALDSFAMQAAPIAAGEVGQHRQNRFQPDATQPDHPPGKDAEKIQHHRPGTECGRL